MLEKMVDGGNESAEEVFFWYSCSCTSDLFSVGLISKEDYDLMNNYMLKKKVPKREELERVYKNAVRRINELAKRRDKSVWDSEVIRDYFLNEHNKAIDEGEGDYKNAPHSLRELCKVRVGRVVEKYNRGDLVFYKVDYGDKKEEAIGVNYPDANVGERISTHWRFAVESIK